jgi:hypothetical protein
MPMCGRGHSYKKSSHQQYLEKGAQHLCALSRNACSLNAHLQALLVISEYAHSHHGASRAADVRRHNIKARVRKNSVLVHFEDNVTLDWGVGMRVSNTE